MLEGTDSLSCTFTVKYRSSPGQCSVNGKTLLLFDDERQNSPVGKPEKKGNATKVCNDLNQSLKDIFQKMTNLVSGLFDQSKGNHTLQVTVQSQYNQGIFMDGCWAFTIDRQYPFYFYPKNLIWRESHPDASRTMSQWQNNRINNNDLGYHPAFICHPDSTHSGQCLICVHHLESIYICIDSMFSNINHQCIDALGAFVVATMVKKKVRKGLGSLFFLVY